MTLRRNFKSLLLLFAAVSLTLPALFIRALTFTGAEIHLEPVVSSLLFGAGIIGAAFLLAWAAEVAELDVSQSLALAVLALIAVLPEYAVDLYFAIQAGGEAARQVPLEQQTYVHFATANMTGANRLLVGLGWPLVALLFWARRRQAINLERGLSLELLFMGGATLYAFTIPFKGSIAVYDGLVLVSLFALYVWLSSKTEHREPELVGPAAMIGSLPKGFRRALVIVMFFFSASVILSSAEPFAEGLLEFGRRAGINEFVMVQWVAPAASEAPEILVAVIYTIQGRAAAAMTALISAMVNQWTLLVGTLPFAYIASWGHFSIGGLPMDARQMEEVWLTAAQSLFAVVLLVRLRINGWGGLALFLLWSAQLGFFSPTSRYIFTFIYLGCAGGLLLFDPRRILAIARLAPDVVASVRQGSHPKA